MLEFTGNCFHGEGSDLGLIFEPRLIINCESGVSLMINLTLLSKEEMMLCAFCGVGSSKSSLANELT